MEKTETTPEINFNCTNGILEIRGESYPEDASKIYDGIIDWVERFIFRKKNIIFNFKLIYFNTSSSKYILDIIELLEEYFCNSGTVEINWHYTQDDEDIKDDGEEFLEDCTLPYQIIEM